MAAEEGWIDEKLCEYRIKNENFQLEGNDDEWKNVSEDECDSSARVSSADEQNKNGSQEENY